MRFKLDAHRIDDEWLRPVVVWCHGDALINGGRQGIGRSGRELIKNGEHGLRDAAKEDIEKAYQSVLPFIAKFVSPPNFGTFNK